MKMISFRKSLETSISLHFASYIHIFICNVNISIDISKMNKFIENLAKLFKKVISFSFTKKIRQLPLVILIHRNLIQFPTVWITRPEEELNWKSSMKSKQVARIKEMKDEQRNFLQMMDFLYPTIFPQTQMPLGQSSDQEKNL